LTVFYPAMGQGKADRLSQRAEMSAITGSELRRATGRLARAKQRRAQARALGLDEKLAKGRALVRPCAAATVTVPNTWAVAEFGRRLDASIRIPGFIPLRLDLAQDSGFAAAAIPLGVGLPRARGRALMLGLPGRRRPGRGVSQLLSDFGHDLPLRPNLEAAGVERNLFPKLDLPSRANEGLRRVGVLAGPVVDVADDLGTDTGVLAADRRTGAAADRRPDGY